MCCVAGATIAVVECGSKCALGPRASLRERRNVGRVPIAVGRRVVSGLESIHGA